MVATTPPSPSREEFEKDWVRPSYALVRLLDVGDAYVVNEMYRRLCNGRLVAAGTGLGLVPRLAVAETLARGEVIELSWPAPAQAANLAAELVMIWRRRRVQPPALKLLLASASTGLDALRPGGAHPRHAEPILS